MHRLIPLGLLLVLGCGDAGSRRTESQGVAKKTSRDNGVTKNSSEPQTSSRMPQYPVPLKAYYALLNAALVENTILTTWAKTGVPKTVGVTNGPTFAGPQLPPTWGGVQINSPDDPGQVGLYIYVSFANRNRVNASLSIRSPDDDATKKYSEQVQVECELRNDKWHIKKIKASPAIQSP